MTKLLYLRSTGHPFVSPSRPRHPMKSSKTDWQTEYQCAQRSVEDVTGLCYCLMQWELFPLHLVLVFHAAGSLWIAGDHFPSCGSFFFSSAWINYFWSTQRRRAENYRHWSFKNEPVGEVEVCMFQVAIWVKILLIKLIGRDEWDLCRLANLMYSLYNAGTLA